MRNYNSISAGTVVKQ